MKNSSTKTLIFASFWISKKRSEKFCMKNLNRKLFPEKIKRWRAMAGHSDTIRETLKIEI